MQSNAVERTSNRGVATLLDRHGARAASAGLGSPGSSPQLGAGSIHQAPWRQGDAMDFLHQSHRVAERAACGLMGVTLSTLAMYNLALWLMR